mgnify:CR=1 FL=1
MNELRIIKRHETETLERALFEVKKVVVGQDHFLERVLVAMLAPEKPLVERPPALDWTPFLRLALMTALFTAIILAMGWVVRLASRLANLGAAGWGLWCRPGETSIIDGTKLGILVLLAITGIVQDSGRSITFDSAGGVLSFDANQFNDLAVGESETLTFTYTVDDQEGQPNSTNTGLLTVIVEGRNDAPVAADASDTTNEDAGTFALDANTLVSDVDASDVLAIKILAFFSFANPSKLCVPNEPTFKV